MGLQRVWLGDKESACQSWRLRHGFNPWVGMIPGEERATSGSILAWKVPWTEEPGMDRGTMGSQGV